MDLRRRIREHEVYEYDVTSFDDGSQVEFSGLLPGTYDVEIECREYQAFDRYPPLVVGEHIETELVVESRRGTIVGVLHDERGRLVADALVVALEQPFRDAGYTATSIDWDRLGEPVITGGAWRLNNLPAGRYALSVGLYASQGRSRGGRSHRRYRDACCRRPPRRSRSRCLVGPDSSSADSTRAIFEEPQLECSDSPRMCSLP